MLISYTLNQGMKRGLQRRLTIASPYFQTFKVYFFITPDWTIRNWVDSVPVHAGLLNTGL